MKPLIVLLGVFVVSLIGTKIFRNVTAISLSGRIAMSVMLLFTALGHFMFGKEMTLMLPDFVPFKLEVVYFTGIIEIAAAIGLFIPCLRTITAGLLIAFLILVLPANIHAALNHVDYQNGSLEGNGPMYLWFRIPLQILFIVWTYFFCLKR